MKRTKIVKVLQMPVEGQQIKVAGWLRSRRGGKGLTFLSLNDGSTIKNLQAVADERFINILGEKNWEELVPKLTTGACVQISGKLVASAGKEQQADLIPTEILVLGIADPEIYPLQKKKTSLEFLRNKAHLRVRTNTFSAVFRIRHALAYAIHDYFHKKGFFYVNTPIITGSDTEGAGEMFRVTTLDMKQAPLTEEGAVDYSKDFFGKETHLTVSGQLNGESLAMGLGLIYTFGPTFRAENSNTTRHLAEFWMVEPEMAFYEAEDNQDLAEDFMQSVIRFALDNCRDDLAFLDQKLAKEEAQLPQQQRRAMGLIEALEFVVKNPFVRITYSEAVQILEQSKPHKKGKFQFPVSWGSDLQSEHERYLVEKHFKCPVIVTDYPKAMKAFYMKQNEDGKTVRAMDVLFPGIGEIIGGSQREESYEKLLNRIEELGLNSSDYEWYMDLRKFGSAPHSGFGLGFERLVQFVTGMKNIRDVIPFPRTPQHADF